MTEIINTYNPDYVIHPGEYLEEILETRELKKRDFAERVGISVKAVSQIINRKSLYSPEIALRFEKTLDIHAEIWMNLVDSYQLFEAKLKEKKNLETEKTKEWINRFPVSDLRKIGILPKSGKPEILADSLLRFFNISSPEVWDEYMTRKAVSFRKSSVFSESRESTAVWLRLAEREAEKIETDNYDRNTFKEGLLDIRKLTTLSRDKFFPVMRKICRKSGVALVLVPELGKTHISGAAYWVTQSKSLIAISLRYKSNDHFWFTFFHEASHLLLHGKKNVYIDRKEYGDSEEEKEANRFAGDILIPPNEYERFISEGVFFEPQIRMFAERIGIHPGIIVGRLQHDNLIEFIWHNKIKDKYEIKNIIA
ncbi:MAG: HigA family addiction module antitoxin [Spirochaetia bacterium]|jgi:HTH-type transcriptional regulator/antitoxin HigA|nr:HigA family addiction module antitoxin [Spirochaetia bacterium]